MKQKSKSPAQVTLSELHEIEITYRRPVLFQKEPITSSKTAHEIFWQFYDKEKMDYKEFFYVLLLNRASMPIGISCIGTGSFSSVVVNRQEIFQLCLKTNACSIILCHNHPSGNLKPSEADNQITRTIKEGGRLLEITLLDHLILTSENYYSYADEGML